MNRQLRDNVTNPENLKNVQKTKILKIYMISSSIEARKT